MDKAQHLVAIEMAENGPYIIKNLASLSNSKGERLETKKTMALCRCGGSKNKPYCDGTHTKNGFSSKNLSDSKNDKRITYSGKKIAIHDNRAICAHAGACTDSLSSVWRIGAEPWINPDGADVDEIIETVRRCPSGALSYSIESVEHRDVEQDPAVYVCKDGPYHVTGGIDLKDVSWAEGASTEHYALCRCGDSKNKPFCDGSHWHIKFQDKNN